MVNAKEVEKDEDAFQEMLDDSYEEINLFGMKYDAGYLLREIDPIAFRCAMADEEIQYQCDNCDAIYDDEDEAEECCKFDIAVDIVVNDYHLNPEEIGIEELIEEFVDSAINEEVFRDRLCIKSREI